MKSLVLRHSFLGLHLKLNMLASFPDDFQDGEIEAVLKHQRGKDCKSMLLFPVWAQNHLNGLLYLTTATVNDNGFSSTCMNVAPLTINDPTCSPRYERKLNKTNNAIRRKNVKFLELQCNKRRGVLIRGVFLRHVAFYDATITTNRETPK